MLRALCRALLIILLISSPAMASLYIDIMGGYTMAGDAKNGLGPGAGIYYDVVPNFSVFLRSSYSVAKTNKGSPDETAYGYVLSTSGVQYRHPVGDTGLYITGAFGAGYSYVYRSEPKMIGEFTDASEEQRVSDFGPCFGFWAGALYMIIPNISVFAELGGHWSFYKKDFADEKVRGAQFLVGVRFTLAGMGRSITDGY